MARKTTAADLTIVFCSCTRTDRLPDGTASEWHTSPRDAALAVKRHVLAEDMYWLVHYVPNFEDQTGCMDTHVVSVVIDGLRYGPGGPTPA